MPEKIDPSEYAVWEPTSIMWLVVFVRAPGFAMASIVKRYSAKLRTSATPSLRFLFW